MVENKIMLIFIIRIYNIIILNLCTSLYKLYNDLIKVQGLAVAVINILRDSASLHVHRTLKLCMLLVANIYSYHQSKYSNTFIYTIS